MAGAANATKNHPALKSHFANSSVKNVFLLEIPLSSRKSDNVSIVASARFEPGIFVCRESGTHRLVTAMLVHISVIST